jgi:outer membrane protein assembly factor BamB
MRVLIALAFPLFLAAIDWPGFRGPNGTGVSDSKDLPIAYGPDQNVVWKIELPSGYSSPVVAGDRIFVTAFEKDVLSTIAIERKTGKVLWRREAPKERSFPKYGVNSPVSPTPVTDGENVYVFFETVGLISYGPDGNERWKVPMGPFTLPYGFGSSPILADGKILMLCDADVGSFLLAVSAKDGKQVWKTPRPDVTHGFSTPVIYQPKNGPMQAIVSGSYNLVSYSVATGEKLWWVGGMAWQAKSIPVIHGDVLYVHSWMADMAGIGLPAKLDTFDEILATNDKDHDGKLTLEELPYPELKKLMFLFDLNHDKFMDRAEWNQMIARNAAKNGVYAIRLDGKRGDLTKTNVLWRYDQKLPNIPSPLLYQDVLYILREGGIMTTLNPATGEIIKQERIKDALDSYFASPVAADGKVFLLSEGCKFSVLKAGGEWEVLGVSDFNESECRATPAIAGNQVYLRTHFALYAFGKKV